MQQRVQRRVRTYVQRIAAQPGLAFAPVGTRQRIARRAGDELHAVSAGELRQGRMRVTADAQDVIDRGAHNAARRRITSATRSRASASRRISCSRSLASNCVSSKLKSRVAEISSFSISDVPPEVTENFTLYVSSYSVGMLRADTESTRSVSSSSCTSIVAPDEPWVRITLAPEAIRALRRSCTKSVCSSLVSMYVNANSCGSGVLPCRWKPQPARPATATHHAANARLIRPA